MFLFITEASAFVLGIASGAILLIVGFALARGLGKRRSNANDLPELDNEQAMDLLSELNRWTEEFKSEVAGYKSAVNEVSERLEAVQDANELEDGPQMVSLLTDILHANQSVQQRLSTAENKLQHQSEEIETYMTEARTDALTGIPNRRAFDDEIARRFAQWQRHKILFSLLIIDVDHFKSFNDRYGHLAGDYVLQHATMGLVRSVRQADFVSRYGGEEFALIFPNQNPDEAKLAAERIRKVIADSAFEYDGQTLEISISGGLAAVQEDDSLTTLIARADEALYESKRSGRNQMHWHDGQQTERIAPAAPNLRREKSNV